MSKDDNKAATHQAKFHGLVAMASEGKTEAFERAITDDPSLLTAQDEHGETLLHYLVVEASAHCVACLIARGADVNTPDRYGNTPLHSAVLLGLLEFIQVLLKAGADAYARSPGLGTPLECAITSEKMGVIEALIKSGVDPNQIDVDGNTALHHAAHGKNREVFDLMISLGACDAARNRFGFTPREILESDLL